MISLNKMKDSSCVNAMVGCMVDRGTIAENNELRALMKYLEAYCNFIGKITKTQEVQVIQLDAIGINIIIPFELPQGHTTYSASRRVLKNNYCFGSGDIDKFIQLFHAS